MGQELVELKKLLKTKSKAEVAFKLGYRTPQTIYYWVKKKRIPLQAIERVRNYLEKESHGRKKRIA